MKASSKDYNKKGEDDKKENGRARTTVSYKVLLFPIRAFILRIEVTTDFFIIPLTLLFVFVVQFRKVFFKRLA